MFLCPKADSPEVRARRRRRWQQPYGHHHQQRFIRGQSGETPRTGGGYPRRSNSVDFDIFNKADGHGASVNSRGDNISGGGGDSCAGLFMGSSYSPPHELKYYPLREKLDRICATYAKPATTDSSPCPPSKRRGSTSSLPPPSSLSRRSTIAHSRFPSGDSSLASSGTTTGSDVFPPNSSGTARSKILMASEYEDIVLTGWLRVTKKEDQGEPVESRKLSDYFTKGIRFIKGAKSGTPANTNIHGANSSPNIPASTTLHTTAYGSKDAISESMVQTSNSNGSWVKSAGSDLSMMSAKERPPNSVYCVLKQNTLFMYDSEQQMEGRGIIILSYYDVSLLLDPNTRDSQSFSRKKPIKLTPHDQIPSSSSSSSPPEQSAKDSSAGAGDTLPVHGHLPLNYYVYCDRPTEKEDWYFALIKASLAGRRDKQSINRKKAMMLDQATMKVVLNNVIADSNNDDDDETQDEALLQEKGHKRNKSMASAKSIDTSAPLLLTDHQPTVKSDEWLNAVLGRIFISVYRTKAMHQYFIDKIQSKFDRIKRPSYLEPIKVADLHVGNHVPIISNPKLLSLSNAGELEMELDVEYYGGFSAELRTAFKAGGLRLSLALAVHLNYLKGRLLVKIKEPPTNRAWVGFYEMPKLDLKINPIIFDRQITYDMVLNVIEKLVYEAISTSIVLPYMDDTVFFHASELGAILENDFPEKPNGPITGTTKGEKEAPAKSVTGGDREKRKSKDESVNEKSGLNEKGGQSLNNNNNSATPELTKAQSFFARFTRFRTRNSKPANPSQNDPATSTTKSSPASTASTEKKAAASDSIIHLDRMPEDLELMDSSDEESINTHHYEGRTVYSHGMHKKTSSTATTGDKNGLLAVPPAKDCINTKNDKSSTSPSPSLSPNQSSSRSGIFHSSSSESRKSLRRKLSSRKMDTGGISHTDFLPKECQDGNGKAKTVLKKRTPSFSSLRSRKASSQNKRDSNSSNNNSGNEGGGGNNNNNNRKDPGDEQSPTSPTSEGFKTKMMTGAANIANNARKSKLGAAAISWFKSKTVNSSPLSPPQPVPKTSASTTATSQYLAKHGVPMGGGKPIPFDRPQHTGTALKLNESQSSVCSDERKSSLSNSETTSKLVEIKIPTPKEQSKSPRLSGSPRRGGHHRNSLLSQNPIALFDDDTDVESSLDSSSEYSRDDRRSVRSFDQAGLSQQQLQRPLGIHFPDTHHRSSYLLGQAKSDASDITTSVVGSSSSSSSLLGVMGSSRLTQFHHHQHSGLSPALQYSQLGNNNTVNQPHLVKVSSPLGYKQQDNKMFNKINNNDNNNNSGGMRRRASTLDNHANNNKSTSNFTIAATTTASSSATALLGVSPRPYNHYYYNYQKHFGGSVPTSTATKASENPETLPSNNNRLGSSNSEAGGYVSPKMVISSPLLLPSTNQNDKISDPHHHQQNDQSNNSQQTPPSASSLNNLSISD
ncbi:hypothetical protein H4219_005171 [Mycoemilia scoparia]|uniref:SMP-LTD domain-containing protein n=1 Tax=Mycoemilia scoparia TaxID=417184 RepID=A0A9W7ZQ35_9FUNG|nr:hypothetical protein H4219_005171 [Mycoemilia scoparia]